MFLARGILNFEKAKEQQRTGKKVGRVGCLVRRVEVGQRKSEVGGG